MKHGATLCIRTQGFDSYHPDLGPHYSVQHFFIVPAATWNRDEWQRWLFDRFVDVEIHEAAEHFTINGEETLRTVTWTWNEPLRHSSVRYR